MNVESKTGAIIQIFLKFAIFSMFKLNFQFGHIHVRLPNFHEYFLFQYRFKLTQVKHLTKVWPSSFLNFCMSKHMKFSEIQENPENCSGFGFYIHNMHVQFPKQMSLLYTGNTEQIIPTKNFEDGGTSIFCMRTGPILMLTVPSPLSGQEDPINFL